MYQIPSETKHLMFQFLLVGNKDYFKNVLAYAVPLPSSIRSFAFNLEMRVPLENRTIDSTGNLYIISK